AIVSQLFGLPRRQGEGITFLWTGERVALAYDAARLFLQAANFYENANGKPVTRTQIPRQFESTVYHGVTGEVSFTATSHVSADTPPGMPLTIVRIRLSTSSAMPT